jgi:hypothetical protein
MATLLHSVREVVSALGGVAVVASRFDCTEQAVFRWLKSEMLPAKTYLAVKADLAEIDRDVPDRLFSMVPVAITARSHREAASA